MTKLDDSRKILLPTKYLSSRRILMIFRIRSSFFEIFSTVILRRYSFFLMVESYAIRSLPSLVSLVRCLLYKKYNL